MRRVKSSYKIIMSVSIIVIVVSLAWLICVALFKPATRPDRLISGSSSSEKSDAATPAPTEPDPVADPIPADSTTVIEETKEGVFLYTANEIDKRGEGGKNKYANCNIRKINALTGQLVWQKDYQCLYNYYINGGALATPVIRYP